MKGAIPARRNENSLPCPFVPPKPLGKTRPGAWRRTHGVHPAGTGTVSVLDRPNVVITLNPPPHATWSRWQVERPLPRHLFVYLDDPAALASAVANALAQAEASS